MTQRYTDYFTHDDYAPSEADLMEMSVCHHVNEAMRLLSFHSSLSAHSKKELALIGRVLVDAFEVRQ